MEFSKKVAGNMKQEGREALSARIISNNRRNAPPSGSEDMPSSNTASPSQIKSKLVEATRILKEQFQEYAEKLAPRPPHKPTHITRPADVLDVVPKAAREFRFRMDLIPAAEAELPNKSTINEEEQKLGWGSDKTKISSIAHDQVPRRAATNLKTKNFQTATEVKAKNASQKPATRNTAAAKATSPSKMTENSKRKAGDNKSSASMSTKFWTQDRSGGGLAIKFQKTQPIVLKRDKATQTTTVVIADDAERSNKSEISCHTNAQPLFQKKSVMSIVSKAKYPSPRHHLSANSYRNARPSKSRIPSKRRERRERGAGEQPMEKIMSPIELAHHAEKMKRLKNTMQKIRSMTQPQNRFVVSIIANSQFGSAQPIKPPNLSERPEVKRCASPLRSARSARSTRSTANSGHYKSREAKPVTRNPNKITLPPQGKDSFTPRWR